MAPKTAPKSAPKALVPSVKPDNRHLATKESQLFKQLLQQYETKQWKKGIKTADAILKTRPDHGGEITCCSGTAAQQLTRRQSQKLSP